MIRSADASEMFGKERISKVLLKIAPPVMLAQLIQALYNVVDSFFVGRDSESGLTALSIIYPVQLLMIAIAVGTGVGINTIMAAKLGIDRIGEAYEYAGIGTPLAGVLWAIFAALFYALMPAYARMSTSSEEVIRDVISYGRIVCVFSFGLFFESVWTKILQAGGDMKTPMAAQIVGAVTNILLDPILIFGLMGFPRLGIAGAAIATVIGQMAAALVVSKRAIHLLPDRHKWLRYVKQIFIFGAPNMLMQAACTFYILGFNLILAGFSDQAVTVLGLYYKWQSFFFIPLGAMQTCIVPLVSFNYSAGNIDRCKKALCIALLYGLTLMLVGILLFELIPGPMLRVFSQDPEVIRIGTTAFRIIAVSFVPIVPSLTFPVFFQAIGNGFKSSFLTITRTVLLFVPLGYLFSKFGLDRFWLTFPVTETLTTLVGYIFYRQFLKNPYHKRVYKHQ